MSRSTFARPRAAALTAATIAVAAGSALVASPASAVVRPTTPGFYFSDYTATGTVALKAAGKPAAVTATVVSGVHAPVQNYNAAATTSTVPVSAKAYGFLPVSADVQTVVSLFGTNTGTEPGPFTSTSVTATAQLKATSIRIAGVTAAGGTACQTAAAPVTLTPAGALFNLGGNGNLSGTFTSGNLSGCGSFTSVVAPILAGAGNSFSLDYTNVD